MEIGDLVWHPSGSVGEVMPNIRGITVKTDEFGITYRPVKWLEGARMGTEFVNIDHLAVIPDNCERDIAHVSLVRVVRELP